MQDDPRDSAVHAAVLAAVAVSARIVEGNSEGIDRDGLASEVVAPAAPAEEAPAVPDSAWVHPWDPIDSASVEPDWEDLLRHADMVVNIPVADSIPAVVPDRHWEACFRAEEEGMRWKDILRLPVRLALRVHSQVEVDRVVRDPVSQDDLPLEAAHHSWKESILRVLDLGWTNHRCVRRWIVLLSQHRCEVFPKFLFIEILKCHRK